MMPKNTNTSVFPIQAQPISENPMDRGVNRTPSPIMSELQQENTPPRTPSNSETPQSSTRGPLPTTSDRLRQQLLMNKYHQNQLGDLPTNQNDVFISNLMNAIDNPAATSEEKKGLENLIHAHLEKISGAMLATIAIHSFEKASTDLSGDDAGKLLNHTLDTMAKKTSSTNIYTDLKKTFEVDEDDEEGCNPNDKELAIIEGLAYAVGLPSVKSDQITEMAKSLPEELSNTLSTHLAWGLQRGQYAKTETDCNNALKLLEALYPQCEKNINDQTILSLAVALDANSIGPACHAKTLDLILKLSAKTETTDFSEALDRLNSATNKIGTSDLMENVKNALISITNARNELNDINHLFRQISSPRRSITDDEFQFLKSQLHVKLKKTPDPLLLDALKAGVVELISNIKPPRKEE